MCLIFIANSLLQELNGQQNYIHYLIEMSVMINSKRDQFRKDIIKKQKQDFFMSRRKQLMRNMVSEVHQPFGEMNPVQALKQRVDMKRAFQYMRTRLDDIDYFERLWKYIEEGLIGVLISFLRDGVQVPEALQLICAILEKKESSLHHASTFYNYGILQYAVNYLQTDLKCSSLSMTILSIFTSKSTDYCEMLLFNGLHKVFMEFFMKRVCNCANAELQNDNQGEKFYSLTLNVLENLLKTKKTVLQFPQQKVQIFNFTLILVERRLFLKTTLGILYECVFELQKEIVIAPTLPLINKILGEVRTEDKYLYNLFALIYIIPHKYGPVEINFQEFYKIGILSKKVRKPFIKIMDMYIESMYAEFTPKNEEWWLELLSQPAQDKLYCMVLRFIDKLEIKSEWVWRAYSAALNQNSLVIQHEAISILNIRIRKAFDESKYLTYLHKHRITTILENLAHKGRTQTIRNEANNLLEFILGPMTERSSEMI